LNINCTYFFLIFHRYPDDVFDRFWKGTLGDSKDWSQLSVSVPAESLTQNNYKPPAIVMSTAVTPANASAPLLISWEPEHETDQFYVYMHFMEIQELTTNQTRQFNIMMNGQPLLSNCSPQYHIANTVHSRSSFSGKVIKYSLERTESSTLPPIISAIEIYRVQEFPQSDTFQGDGKSRNYRILNPFLLYTLLYMILTTFYNFLLSFQT